METNKILKGSNAKVWFNTEVQSMLDSIEIKVTGEFEDVVSVGKKGTAKAYLGFTGEGSMTRKKTDSRLLKVLADGYKSGEMPDIKIMTSVMSGGKSERIVITGVTIPDFFLAKIEGKSMMSEEIPFAFEDYEVLDTI